MFCPSEAPNPFVEYVRLFAAFLLTFALHSDATNPRKILTVGDSWASYSGNTFSQFCRPACGPGLAWHYSNAFFFGSGAVQINRGIGGTTAVQWTAGSGDTNFADAIAAAGTMDGNDIIVLSVGGNDWIGLNPPCTGKTLQTLQGEIQAAVDALKQAVTNTGCGGNCPAIWMFGYAMVTSGEDGCGNQSPAALGTLKDAVSNVATATSGIHYLDITTICGGSPTAYSPASPCFGMGNCVDNIHMNRQGYCRVITQPAVQAAFGCDASTHNCDSEPYDLSRISRDAATCTAYTACNVASNYSTPLGTPAPITCTASEEEDKLEIGTVVGIAVGVLVLCLVSFYWLRTASPDPKLATADGSSTGQGV